MQKIWFIFNFTTLALLIWDVINASPRQLISQCRKLSPPFHQNSVTLAPLCSVVMQLGYQGNPKVLIFFCCIAEGQKFLCHKSYSRFWWTKNLDIFFFFLLEFKKKEGAGVLNGACGTRCSWTQVYNAAYCSPQHLLYCCEVNWFTAENSLLLQVEVSQSCPLGKGIFVKANLYKWEMCSLFKFKRAPSFSPPQPPPLASRSPSVSYIQTHSHTTAHFQYSHSFLFPQRWLWNDSIF